MSASSECVADLVDIDWGLSVPFGGFGAEGDFGEGAFGVELFVEDGDDADCFD